MRPIAADLAAAADQLEAFERARRRAGAIAGKHYTQYVDQVKELKRAGDYVAAMHLLLRMLDAVEAEARAGGPTWSVPPWCYEQLAGLHRKAKSYRGEVATLRRYIVQHEGKSEQPYPTVIARLEKAEGQGKNLEARAFS